MTISSDIENYKFGKQIDKNGQREETELESAAEQSMQLAIFML